MNEAQEIRLSKKTIGFLKNFSEIIGFNLDNVLSKISSLEKLY